MKDWTTEIDGKEATLRCTHASQWPPVHIQLGDIEDLRATGTIDDHTYEQIKTWKRLCGLKEMGPKCLECPLAKVQGAKAARPNLPHPPFARSRWK